MARAVFTSNVFEQKKTLEELIEESKADGGFYLLLVVSSVITTLGLLIDNQIVVIGGMLVAPLLHPILFLSMAITTSSKEGISRALKTIGKSILLVFAISLLTAFLFHADYVTGEILDRTSPNLPLFLVAFFAGVAGAFGWARHELSATIAGIAVSVSLIPPLATVGVGVALLSRSVIAGSLTLFLINLFGIVLAGIVVFLLYGFSQLQKEEEDIIREEKAEEEIRERAVAEGKVEERIQKAQLGITKENE